jgi:hypothetical protein
MDVANGFPAEAFLEFSQDFGLRDLFDLVVQTLLWHKIQPGLRAKEMSSEPAY